MKRCKSLIALMALPLAAAACGAPETREAPAPVVQAPPPPAAAPELVFPQEAFRATQPAGEAPRQADLPTPTTFTLANGIQVYLVERHDLPTVSLELDFPGGSVDDPKGKEGLAGVCTELLSEGTQALDKLAFEEAQADLASSVSSGAGRETLSVSMATLTKHLDATLDLWAATIRTPGLRAEEFDRLIKQRKATLLQIKGNASALAGRLAGSVVWGPEHPYGRLSTEMTFDALKLDDCKAWATKRFLPGGAQLFVVGDVTQAQLTAKLDARFQGWKGASPKAVKIGKAAPRKGKVFFVDVPGAEQAVVAVMHPGPDRKATDYYDTALLTTILGGGFSSRINMNIREKHGYAYGARGGFDYQRAGSAFMAQASVRNDAAGASVREILNEMKGVRDAEVTVAELTREKEGAILGLPARWATGRSVLGTFQMLVYYGLPLDTYTRYIQDVQAVDAAKALAAARKYILPTEALALVVGDGTKLRPQVDALVAADGAMAGGTVVDLDAYGKVLPAPKAAAVVPAAAPAAAP